MSVLPWFLAELSKSPFFLNPIVHADTGVPMVSIPQYQFNDNQWSQQQDIRTGPKYGQRGNLQAHINKEIGKRRRRRIGYSAQTYENKKTHVWIFYERQRKSRRPRTFDDNGQFIYVRHGLFAGIPDLRQNYCEFSMHRNNTRLASIKGCHCQTSTIFPTKFNRDYENLVSNVRSCALKMAEREMNYVTEHDK
ncbi:hypothetical protein KAFR_0K01970 [Kazachstania africana CBS 2517]|uniref:Uncharacterized protein n=1 Tax=Kazachstania africana (strain ATCC 22294 / BCRC 22015 / CBS 2517 / CECT 1963 / NBRC 1671 / NRRL Y-8276) TaxID=1071382 RepID=H2B1Q1_KAZAF|nr:hypothetical protein KAFR_0K01970 [Kazachstania africana CBS 2517]CCF60551.1 hypothetical protein KAFR_0K01970 [Kazachstania africana CBS 2517]